MEYGISVYLQSYQQLNEHSTCVCSVHAQNNYALRVSVNKNARASEKYAVQFQLMFVK